MTDWQTTDGYRWKPATGIAKVVECPQCFRVGRDDDGSGMLTDVRNAQVTRGGLTTNVVSFAYRCPACGHVFGHAPDVPLPSPPPASP